MEHPAEVRAGFPATVQVILAARIDRLGRSVAPHPIVASLLGSAYTLAGRIAEGLPLLELAVAQAASMGLMYGHSLWVSLLGEGYLLAGRLEEAHAAGGGGPVVRQDASRASL